MTLPALWIRRNMLQSPGPAYNNNERSLTEAEMKVQRSLKKLSIPEWYLNNSSHPPKILMNDTPIELRPPSWKEQSVTKSVPCNTLVTPYRNATVNRNGVLETEIGRPISNYQSYGTYKINRNSLTNRSPESKKRSSPQKKSRLANVSRTFPRISPSRKIQNINIVFDEPPESSRSLTIADLDVSEPDILFSDDSLNEKIIEPTILTPPTLSESVMITDLDQSEPEIGIEDSLILPDMKTNDRRLETPPISSESYIITDLDESQSKIHEIEDSSSLPHQSAGSVNQTIEDSRLADLSFETNTYETKAWKMPNRQLTYIKPWKPSTRTEFKSCVTPEGKFATATNFKFRTSSTPQGSPVSLFSVSTIDAIPRKNAEQPTTDLSISSSNKNGNSPPTSPAAIALPISYAEEICDVCKGDPSKSRSSPPPGRSSSFRPRNLLSPIGETPSSSSQSVSRSSSIACLTSKKKSSELESLVKRKQRSQQGKSLVQEIIEELNEKCRTSAQPTYVSPGSKNFVKKLVRALEKGETPRPREEEESSYRSFADYEDDEEYNYSPEDRYVESENSEDEVKSVAVSTSISYKDTDSSSNGSDTDLRSPTMKVDYKYDWNMNVEKNRNVPIATIADTTIATSTPESTEKDNDSVYWIPVAKTKLPRTSSLLSMMSRLSTANPGQQSPCISPIKQTNDVKPNAWGATYRTNEQPRTLRRIDETTILDSGYSDRSRGHSSGSDDTWFDDTESTWTASENGSCSNFSYSLGSRLRQERRFAGQIHGRPFVI